MLRKLYLINIVLLCFSSAYGIEAVESHSVFFLPDPVYAGNLNPYVEAYWQINPRSVRYNTIPEKGIVARIKTDVMITNDTGMVLKEDHYIYQTIGCKTADELGGLNILELKRYLVVAGKIKMVVRLTDMNDTTNVLTLTDSFSIAKNNKQPFFATPELVDTFYESDVRTPFKKHGRQYIPICAPFIDDYKNSVSYYTELYNTDGIEKEDFPLTLTVFISKKQYESPFTKYQKIDTFKTTVDSNYVAGYYDIRNLPSGNYYLNVMLGNKMHRTLAKQSVFFQRENRHKSTEELTTEVAGKVDTGMESVTFLNLSKTFIAKYDVGQLKAILKMLYPVSDVMGQQAIEGFLKKPDEMYMRYFIYNHFVSINKKDPSKAWKDFTEEIKEVNKMYNTSSTPGYETSRGMMYLRYGAPTEIVTVENEAGTLPYEIWQYNQLTEKSGKTVTNAVILFYKSSETSFDFKLLHTTIQGEFHNAGWRQYLYLNSDGGNNLNSRAEQYLGTR